MLGLLGKIYLFGYNAIGKNLPSSGSKIRIGQKAIRRWLAKGFAAYIGEKANIESKVSIPVKLYLGKESGIGHRSFIQGETHIGDYVMMGPECNIWTVNHETSDLSRPMSKQGSQKERPVYIGNDVWIGSRVTILPGVKIGNGVIVGAGAVVSRDVPDFAVVVGNPAKIVRYRTDVPEKRTPTAE